MLQRSAKAGDCLVTSRIHEQIQRRKSEQEKSLGKKLFRLTSDSDTRSLSTSSSKQRLWNAEKGSWEEGGNDGALANQDI